MSKTKKPKNTIQVTLHLIPADIKVLTDLINDTRKAGSTVGKVSRSEAVELAIKNLTRQITASTESLLEVYL